MTARDPIQGIAPLADPVRRRLYDAVAASGRAMDRDEAAAAAGIGRPLAAFHLDRLAAAGLLDVEYRRRSGRSGPGAGRPAKFYRRPWGREISVSLPPRRYDTVADVLAEGVEQSPDARDAALGAAAERGRAIVAESSGARDRAGLLMTLTERGYEPAVEPDGTIRLANCPFDRMVADHRELTCSLNLAMLGAIADGFDAGMDAEARPAEARSGDGRCCVAFVPR